VVDAGGRGVLVETVTAVARTVLVAGGAAVAARVGTEVATTVGCAVEMSSQTQTHVPSGLRIQLHALTLVLSVVDAAA
jgi:hypothetical protein